LKNDTTLDRIAQLEADLAALKAQVAPAAPVKAAQPKPIIEEGTRVINIAPRSEFIMPSTDELHRLRAIVAAKFPKLNVTDGLIFRGDAEQNEQEYFKQFCASFRALGALHRTERPDRKRYVSYWIDTCEDLLKAVGNSTSISGLPFIAAALSHGDVCYSGLFVEGSVLELGLNSFGIGKPPRDAWKRVLSTGHVLPMILPPASRNYAPPPFQIVGVA
jgi:hypothetical protein